MKCISIYSRCRAADPALSIYEITDGGFICRRHTRIARDATLRASGLEGGRCAADAADRKLRACEPALVCRGISGVDRYRPFCRRTAAALPPCPNIHLPRQHRTAQCLAVGNQGQLEVIW